MAHRLATLALLVLCGACQGLDPIPKQMEPTDAERARFVRMRLEDARAFKAQGKLDSAASAVERALAVAPDDVRALRLLARIEGERGAGDDAARLRARADALDPPPAPPPDTPLVSDATGILAVLIPPAAASPEAAVLAGEWPDRAVPATLAARLRTRLPKAGVTELAPASVAQARAWLRSRDVRLVVSIQVERANCGESVKDGPFALAQLRVAASTPDAMALAPTTVREVDVDPAPGARCLQRALAVALEHALAQPALRDAFAHASGGAQGAWPSSAVRPLFPGLGVRIAYELERGRTRLAGGRLADAEESFRRAEAVDPDDLDTRAYLADVRSTLTLAKEIQAQPGARPPDAALEPDAMDVELSPEARQAAEAQLADERRRRDELLTALALASGEEPTRSAPLLAALRPVDLPQEGDLGLALARKVAKGDVERRAFFGPDGKRLASYYVDDAGTPVLREEDRDGDGVPDRWTAYGGGRRTEVWEARGASGVPGAHILLDPSGAVSRIEVLRPSDGRPERVFRYESGRLTAEASDTNGDGVLDRFETFDADGEVVSREEDLNGDGRIDVRSIYEKGRLVRREISDPALVDGMIPH